MTLTHRQAYEKKQKGNKTKWTFLGRRARRRAICSTLDSCLLLYQAVVQNKVKGKTLEAAKSVQTPSGGSRKHPHS